MGNPVTAAIVLGGIATGAQVGSIQQQRKAQSAQRKASALERRGAELQNVRARRAAVREAISQQQTAIARGVSLGGPSSTAVQQSLSDIQTTLGGNLAIQATLEDLSKKRLSQLDKASKFSTRAQEFAGLSQLAITGAGLSLSSPVKSGGSNNG